MIERAETSLPTEFHNWAQTYEVRARGTVQVVHNFEERLMLAEERIKFISNARDNTVAAVRSDPMSKMNQAAVDALIVNVDPDVMRKANEQAAPPK